MKARFPRRALDPRRAFLRISIAVAIVISIDACGATSPHHVAQNKPPQLPRLGSTSTNLSGFAQVRPSKVWLGGDSTSAVLNIHWSNWGGLEAVGSGESVWVWPGTCTGCNPESRARVVAFHLGVCNGHPSYNALEWYFPQYNDKFSPTRFINTCTHADVGYESYSPSPQCPAAPLAGGGVATAMTAEHMSCAQADRIILRLPAGPFPKERRFTLGGFRCGTQGTSLGPGNVECARGPETVYFDASY